MRSVGILIGVVQSNSDCLLLCSPDAVTNTSYYYSAFMEHWFSNWRRVTLKKGDRENFFSRAEVTPFSVEILYS